jgi:hypothetical protein
MRARDAVVSVVLAWANSMGPQRIAECAAQNRDVVSSLVPTYGAHKRLAWSLLGAAGMAELRSMRDLDWVVDEILRHRQDVGLVLWRYKPWFLGQLRRALDQFLVPA